MSNQINFTNESGKLIPLADIINQVENVYNQVAEQVESEEQSFLDVLTDPEAQIDSEKALETLNFLERTLHLYGPIEPELATAYADAIRFWNKIDELDQIPDEDRKPIKIYIDSPGGDLDATFSISDSIKLSKTPVWTIVIGRAYSGGFFIGISGHKRFGYPHSSYLFHEGAAQNGGDAHKYLQGAKFYEKQLSLLKEITLKNTKISETKYTKHKKDDLWMTAKKACKFGVIDEIIEEII